MFFRTSRTCLFVAFLPSLALGQDSDDSPGAPDPTYQRALAALRAAPNDIGRNFEYARTAAEAGDAAGLIAALERILVANPELSNLRLELGLLYLQRGAPILAEHHLRDALAEPAMPADVRQRAEDLLAASEQAQARWRSEGFVRLGGAFNTNANSGPDGTVQFVTDIGEVEGRLRSEDTGQADLSASGSAGVTAYYDLGFQAGHELFLEGLLYGEAYREQKQLDLGYGQGRIGVDLFLGPSLGTPTSLRLAAQAATLSLGGDSYLSEAGVSAEAAIRTGPKVLWQGGLVGKAQDFRNTSDAPRNSDRDGALYSATLGVAYDVSTTVQVIFDLYGQRKTADADFEAYWGYGGRARIRHLFRAPLGNGEQSWEVSALADVSRVDYDDLNLSIDLDTAQQDNRFRGEVMLSLPLSLQRALEAQIGYYENSSNFAIQDYDDTYTSMSLIWRF